MTREQFTMRFSKDIMKRLRIYCIENDLKPNETIEEAIVQFLSVRGIKTFEKFINKGE